MCVYVCVCACRDNRHSIDLQGRGHAAHSVEFKVSVRINQIKRRPKTQTTFCHGEISLHHQYSMCVCFRRRGVKEQAVFYLFYRTDVERQKYSLCVWNSALRFLFFFFACFFIISASPASLSDVSRTVPRVL